MPTKTFTRTKSTLLALTGSTSLGGGADLHLPCGYNSGYKMRGAVKFSLNWTGVTKITSAKLYLRKTNEKHLNFGSDPDIYIRRITTGSWSPNGASSSADGIGGSGWTGSGATYNDIAGASTREVTFDVPTSTGTWCNVDVTDIIEDWAPTYVERSDGGDGRGFSNDGILLRPVNEGSSWTSENVEFRSGEDWGAPYIELTYTSTEPPLAPINLSPTGGVIVNTVTPTLNLTHRDEDGHAPDYFQVQVSTDNTFAAVTHWDYTHGPISYPAGGEPEEFDLGVAYDYDSLATDLTRGTTYYWRARTSDATDGWGTWSAAQSFVPNQLPTISGGDLSNSRIVAIHNLDDVAVWSGSEAKPKFTWVFSDADGDSQQAFQVQVGTTAGASDVADSGEVASTDQYWECSAAVPRDTIRYWRVRVKDSRGEWSNYSSNYSFKVQWAQSIYEQSVTGGTSSGSWQFNATTSGNSAFLFSSATGTNGTGRGSWNSSIGAVSPNAYVNILVRLGAGAGGTNATISDMDFSYTAAAATPDNWAFLGSNTTSWSLDADTRRFGSKSLKFNSTSTGTSEWSYAEPYRLVAQDGLSVTPGTEYTLSAFIKTNGALANIQGRLELRDASGVVGSTSWVDDSSSSDGGWERVSLTYTVPGGTFKLYPRCVVYKDVAGTGDVLWFDSMKLEESPVASSWTPGFISKASVIDAIGLQIDADEGGVFRLQDSTADNTVSLGTKGLNFKENSSGNNADIYYNGVGITVTDDISSTDGLNAKYMNLSEPSGYSYIEVNGSSGSYIDLHGPNSSDYGARLIVTGTESANGGATLAVTAKNITLNSEIIGSKEVNVYTTGSGASFTLPSYFASIEVEVQGGGGGGGGCSNPGAGNACGATGGSGGGYAKKVWSYADLSALSTLTYTVGAAGSAGATSSAGGAGGESKVEGTGLTTVSGLGGVGGRADASGSGGNSATEGQAGGTASGGDINIRGGSSPNWRGYQGVSMLQSGGGDSQLGVGGRARVNDAGLGGQGYGAGGSGGDNTGNNAANTGGAGTAGVVIITVYY